VEIQETLARLQELQGDQAQSQAQESRLVSQVETLDQDIRLMEERLQAANVKRAQVVTELTELRAWVAENVRPGEIAVLQETLSRSQEINEEARKYAEWVRENAKLEKAQAIFSAQDALVKEKDKQKRETLEAIQWPVPGCSIEEGVIHFRGVPLSQCGNSEQLLVCGALAADQISQAVVRVVRLDGVESMSAEDFAQLETLFEERGIQVLSSRVSRGDLEDGEILIHEGKIQEVGE
jgi:outer membrane murein-binding lipoprotein Lpp